MVESFHTSIKLATEEQAGDDTLIVYRDKRFCPFTSRLPEDYQNKISKLKGVMTVIPVQVVVNNCSTSLDTVTFRGFPDKLAQVFFKDTNIKAEQIINWQKKSDAAIVGKDLASRRGLRVGDSFDAAGITVRISSILDSDDPQYLNAAYVHLDFLQKASRRGLGEVTQFNVKVHDYREMDSIAKNIDNMFRYDREPTHTRSEKAFVANTAKDMMQLIGFTRWLGLASVFAVLMLIVNTIIIAIRGRVKENAILQCVGFQTEHLVWMTLSESILIGVLGGFLGISVASLILHYGHIAISSEGLTIAFSISPQIAIESIVIAIIIGLIAGIYPAMQSVRSSLVQRLREA
jgi:putative ABC transport system permease protein